MKEQEKYSLIIYNPNDIQDFKIIKINNKEKLALYEIDKYLTRYKKEEIMSRLKNIATDTQTELAIVYKYKGLVKLPVIYDDLKLCSFSYHWKENLNNDKKNEYISWFLYTLNKIRVNQNSDLTYIREIIKEKPFILSNFKQYVERLLNTDILKYEDANDENLKIEKELYRKAKYGLIGLCDRYDVFRNIYILKEHITEMNVKNDEDKVKLTEQEINEAIDLILTKLKDKELARLVNKNERIPEGLKNNIHRYSETYDYENFGEVDYTGQNISSTLRKNEKMLVLILGMVKK